MLQKIDSRVSHSPRFITFPNRPRALEAVALTNNDRPEVMAFLAERPVHTIMMASFINDNGLVSELNRGKFYGYRDLAGNLEGVALIGHSTLVEARSNDALMALAVAARSAETRIHLVMSSGDAATKFWKHVSGNVNQPRLTCTEVLFQVSFPFLVQQSKWRVEPAQMDRLVEIAKAQAEVAFLESGVDPLQTDREGFLKRVARRIEENRVFLVLDGDRLVFKADIIAESNDTIYLEGVYVTPDYRGRGIGSKCLASLTLELLARAGNICLLSNVEFAAAHRTFEKAGFHRSDQYTTLFV